MSCGQPQRNSPLPEEVTLFEETIVKDQVPEEEHNSSSNIERMSEVPRREFLQHVILVASGWALNSLLPPFARKTWAAGLRPYACPAPEPLHEIMEIKSSGKTLRAVLKILDEEKTYHDTACMKQTGRMRYFSGYDEINPDNVWPTTKGFPTPGPTLRARVGDTVQVTLLNHVNVNSKFPLSLDVADKGQACDRNVSVGPDGAINTYPGDPSFENPPNCFHGSSTTNLHFHGTHTSPSGIADNVLLNIRPSPQVDGKPVVDEKLVAPLFKKIFAACGDGHQPMLWTDWPPEWQALQKKLLTEFDKTLPPDQQLWPQNEKAIAQHQLPQYYMGAFPNCFKIPEWNCQKNSMGQAPGTHWYHAHKHGSTALNLSNGMAGVLIIEGDYDEKLKPFFTKERVLIVQEYAAVLGSLRAQTGNDLVYVNGQFTPVLQMNPNEMQLWRVVNACHQAALPLNAPPAAGIKWVQTAQDGVQFDTRNYDPSLTNASFPVPARSKAPFGSLAAGNRIDLLVQAPSAPGSFPVTYGSSNTVLFSVKVEQDANVPAIPNPMPFPTREQFPTMPGFLADIKPSDVTVRRDLRFKSSPTPKTDPRVTPPSTHTINEKQFEMGTIDQTMQLGAIEEWTLFNDAAGAAHPFHIHVNPFQVLEIKDPKQNGGVAVTLPAPWIWWDNFAIPPGGYVKILTRFSDFTGLYVLHCHILSHEDRGMMQLVQVVPNTTNMTHK